MAFPVTPSNGQSITLNGITYSYSNTSNAWTRVTLAVSAPAASSYANSAFATANTAFISAINADDKAVSAGSYSNSAFAVANNGVGIDATQNTNITSAATYANSGFSVANTAFTSAFNADDKAVSAGSYANSAYTKANTAVSSYVVNSNSVILSTNTNITANATILPNTGGLSIGPIYLASGFTVTVSANSRWLVL
jgi:hypothetical protein